MEGGAEIVKILIGNGADKNAQITEGGKMFYKGSTPLDIAIKIKYYEMVKFLELHGCKRQKEIRYNTKN